MIIQIGIAKKLQGHLLVSYIFWRNKQCSMTVFLVILQIFYYASVEYIFRLFQVFTISIAG